MSLNIKRIAGIIACAVCFSVPSIAEDYVFDTPGTTISYKCVYKKDGHEMPFVEKVRVLDPATINNKQFNIINHIVLKGQGFSDEKVMFYVKKDDGIYLEATAPRLGGQIRVFENPSLELPLPPEKGKKWKKQRLERGNLVNSNCEIVAVNEPLEINGVTEKTVHVHVEGTIIHDGISSKVQKDIYYTKMGKIKSVTKKFLENGKFTVSEIEFNGITSRNKKEEGQQAKKESDSPKQNEQGGSEQSK